MTKYSYNSTGITVENQVIYIRIKNSEFRPIF